MLHPQAHIDFIWLKQSLENKNLVAALKNTKLIICDVDGALTDAHVYVSPQGEGGRLFSTQDGYIVKHVQDAGFKLALMSGKDNSSTLQRAKKLGIPEELCTVGLLSKIEAVQQLQQKLNIGKDQTIMYGDDFLDASVKLNNLVGLYVCPHNTPFYLQPVADLVIPRGGGQAAFRLFMDLFLFAHEKHFAQDLIKKLL